MFTWSPGEPGAADWHRVEIPNEIKRVINTGFVFNVELRSRVSQLRHIYGDENDPYETIHDPI